MARYTFKWANPTADTSDVLVTGSFDGWTKSVKLDQEAGVFLKTVEIPEEHASSKIYYKFVVDNNWTIDESLPHEPDHEGNVNNFLTPDHLVLPTLSAPAELTAEAPFLNTVSPDSTTVVEMAKNKKKGKAANKQPAAVGSVAAVPETPEPMATPCDVPGGFPVTPAAEDADLQDKTVSISPLPATAGIGNPIKLAPGEKIPDSITSQDIHQHVKLDKESYDQSDALPTAPVLSTDLPPVSGTMIPESSLPMGDQSDVNNPVISSVGPDATTIALAGQVPLEPKVPVVVRESQEKAGVPPEASAVAGTVQDKAKVEEEIKAKVPEAPAASAGTDKGENAGTILATAAAAGSAAVAAAVAAVTKLSEDATPVVNNAISATTETISKTLPESVLSSLPVSAQEALAAGKDSPLDDVSPEVPEKVKDSIAEAGGSPEAAASTSAVQEKKAVEAELLKEVEKKPAADESSKPAGDLAPETTAATAAAAAVPSPAEAQPFEAKPFPVKIEPTGPSVEAPTVATPAVNGNGNGNGVEAKATEPAAANGTSSDSKPADSTHEKKKKNRLSVMFGKLKAKLK
ncbi:uncharacterized protein UV8b_04710 [Ustilaginoidea virens]|uniref:AMP-activated protein kinase glycogen-binding domain-containing protein n=1 Tax=Ustilaginoidea virens TaxID=1159556 RepID=A0A8E5HRY7_USTVR|nr:uncharacterized protein UV8b_04710 [Ustilaginoidea virens]QUC20469.1 hypothetical protein UV8b_04710 [Ustilaginoidea virens]